VVLPHRVLVLLFHRVLEMVVLPHRVLVLLFHRVLEMVVLPHRVLVLLFHRVLEMVVLLFHRVLEMVVLLFHRVLEMVVWRLPVEEYCRLCRRYRYCRPCRRRYRYFLHRPVEILLITEQQQQLLPMKIEEMTSSKQLFAYTLKRTLVNQRCAFIYLFLNKCSISFNSLHS
jgi:hypothetical protein